MCKRMVGMRAGLERVGDSAIVAHELPKRLVNIGVCRRRWSKARRPSRQQWRNFRPSSMLLVLYLYHEGAIKLRAYSC